MKIALIVNPLIPVPPEQYGGIERVVYVLIRELIKMGHNVTLYANPNSQPGCKLMGYRESENYGLKDFIKINRLTSSLLFKNFDVVHTFGRMSNIASLMPFKQPKIVSYQLPPTISQVKKAVNIAAKNSLYFTACSHFIAGQISHIGKVTTIYNSVDMADYQFNAEVDADAPLVFLGRIQQEKGTAIAIEIALKTNKKLIIAGNIPAEQIHQQYFNEQVRPFIDQNQIKYIGPVNNSQKNELLGKACAMLMPVTWDEPFGIVMAEALACGTPVIGFNRGAVPEVVTNGSTGFVCSNINEMIEVVNNISTLSRSKCRQVAEEKFSSAVMATQYEQLYYRVSSS
ncbi:Glycosyltransferase involved in cell wall bisynthesis [Mucilaginibacter lappiensis]|uniref:Glycosyltransferase involved in cell wall biosynthesis n=1 Tax=Mucilaginibacter lappiensis TaxID=354630 RepID=A0ABR6PMB3_9SPHI|nr:glycosyltransferase family 4 protein [Mucilaginibacter lappiensis]MBB6110917.1 glycosyltransferase involved in cell wall biosynthesis [Mucilaginibacter lappiensis]SIR60659.1 Glycosyltransferase involved in cell wall bisynthesis [Mucilaginibacter lappiensis]